MYIAHVINDPLDRGGSSHLPTALLAHIAIPVIMGLVLVLFVKAAANQPLSWESCNDVAIDFILISLGATGALFLNPKLAAKWGEGQSAVYGILIVAVNLLLAAALVYLSKYRKRPIGAAAGFLDMFLGVFGLLLVSSLYYWGYKE